MVIIGLIIGGVLTGQDLIRAAETRAQIAQIEKYNTGVHTFQLKYGYLPGDIPDPAASAFGFVARGAGVGQGDGNGVIQANGTNGNGAIFGWIEGQGETAMFWRDLSFAGLIDGSFSTALPNSAPATDISDITTISTYFPKAKLGNGGYVYVWNTNDNSVPSNGFLNPYPSNYFGISAVTGILNATNFGKLTSNTSVSVVQAYNIDTKIDDGLPLSGSVQAIGLNNDPRWSASSSSFKLGGFNILYYGNNPANVNLFATDKTACMDNNNSPSNDNTKTHYTISNGSALNCALSIKFQ